MIKISFVIVLLFSAVFAWGEEPALTVTIGADALESGINAALPNILLSKLTNVTIAEVSGTTREFIFLYITYNITDIVINHFSVDYLNLYSIDGGYKLDISGVVCNVSFNWQYTDQTFVIIHVSDHGTGTMAFYDGSYEAEIKIKARDGRPYFDLTKNNLVLQDFNLVLDGGADWFYDIFNFIIAPIVRGEVQSIVEDIVSDIVNQLNDRISNIPTTFPLPAGIAFNWALLSDFDTHDNGFGSFYSAGYFVPQNDESADPPFTLQSIPNQVNNEQVQIIISQYTLNTLGWALFEAGSLNVTLPFGTTNDWRVVLPALYRAYPDTPVSVNLVSYIYPAFSINSTGVLFQMAPYMYWNVIQNGTTVNAFSLLIELSVSVDLYFDDTELLLHGDVGVPTFTMSLASTNIGDFSLLQLEAAVNTVIYIVVLPTVNRVLRQGIPIPVLLGFTLESPTIAFEQGYLYFSSNIDFVKLNGTLAMEQPTSHYGSYFADHELPALPENMEFLEEVLKGIEF